MRQALYMFLPPVIPTIIDPTRNRREQNQEELSCRIAK